MIFTFLHFAQVKQTPISIDSERKWYIKEIGV